MEKVLLLGGPGNLSTSTIEELLEKKKKVAVFTLPKSDGKDLEEKVVFYRGDRDDIPCLRAAVEEYQPDVVIDFVCFEPEQAKRTAELLNSRVKQYIFLSTVDVYGYPLSHLPMREYDEKRKPNCEYAEKKLECEKVLLGFREETGFPLTIIRPVYSFGTGFVLDFLSRSGGVSMVSRLKNRRPVLVPGGGNTLIHVSSAYNTGRMIAQFAGHLKSVGKIYNCGHPVPMTHDQYVELFAGVLGEKPCLVHIPFEHLMALKMPEIGEILPILSRFNLFFSIEEFQREFPEFEWTYSLEDAAGEYIEYQDRRGSFRESEKENFEDKIVREWLRCVEGFGK